MRTLSLFGKRNNKTYKATQRNNYDIRVGKVFQRVIKIAVLSSTVKYKLNSSS